MMSQPIRLISVDYFNVENNNNTEFHGWWWWVGWGGPSHYVVTPTQVQIELMLSWVVTKTKTMLQYILMYLEVETCP